MSLYCTVVEDVNLADVVRTADLVHLREMRGREAARERSVAVGEGRPCGEVGAEAMWLVDLVEKMYCM